MREVTSRHLRNASELLVLAPIKQGFVPIVTPTLSYASRLRLLLGVLYEGRRINTEQNLDWVVGPVEKLRSISNSQWTVLENNRYLLVTVTFDRSWEEYFHLLVEHDGPALDLIFSHCEGYVPFSCVGDQGKLRYQGFSAYIRRYQVPCDFYYASHPDLTDEDVAYMQKLAALREPSPRSVAELSLGTVEQEYRERRLWAVRSAAELEASKVPGLTPQPRFVRELLARTDTEVTLMALNALHRLGEYFPDIDEDPGQRKPPRTARETFNRGVRNLIPLSRELAPQQGELGKWLEELQGVSDELPVPPPRTQLDARVLDDVQANILTSYDRMSHGCTVLLRCEGADGGRAFLQWAAERVTSHASYQHAPAGEVFMNLAITHAGLSRLGLDADVLDRFPKELREGMERRAGALGDIGPHGHPENWQLPKANYLGVGVALAAGDLPDVPLSSIDLVVTLQAQRLGAPHDWLRHPLREAVEQLARDGARVLHVQLMRRELVDGQPIREHFGFADGSSQPAPDVSFDGYPDPPGLQRDLIALGELLLGYPDNRDEIACCARPDRGESRALFLNGSFFVLRKLEQDVAAFDAYAERNASDAQTADQVKEWIVGRRLRQNVPLVGAGRDLRDFDYSDDTLGRACPFHAHVRRANHRQVDEKTGRGKAPRIVRRGFSYGPRYGEGTETEERGLMFGAYNASIAGQFEVVQRWINGGNSSAVLSAQNDLFTGNPQPGAAPHWVYTADGWRALLPPEQPFVRLHWGLYAFAPSRNGLRWLASTKRARAALPPETLPIGRELLAMLTGTAPPRAEDPEVEKDAARREAEEAARFPWQSALEEPANTKRAVAIWAALRERGGVLNAPAYGVLVAGARGAAEVLSGDGQKFSVREYYHRLCAATGEHYLALDPKPGQLAAGDADERNKHAAYEARLASGPGYAELGGPANAFIEREFGQDGEFGPAATFAAARVLGRAALDAALGDGASAATDLRAFAALVIAKLSRSWFGLPAIPHETPGEDAQLPAAIMPFVLASQFSFQPYPNAVLRAATHAMGAEIQAHAVPLPTKFSRALAEARDYGAPAVRAAMVGSVVGFAAPAIASVLAVVAQWRERGTLDAIGERWTRSAASDPQQLSDEVVRALMLTPIPSLLYRTAMEGATVGGVPIKPGSTVVVGLGSAALETGDFNWLFGGTRKDNPHACPARSAAIAAVSGAIAALLERDGLAVRADLLVSFGRAVTRAAEAAGSPASPAQRDRWR